MTSFHQQARLALLCAAIVGVVSCSAAPGEPGENNANCGDGVRQPIEQCEGADLGGQSCEGLGLGSGTLSCTQCVFDTTGCAGCGNGLCDPAETRTSCPADCGVRLLAAGEGHACAALGDSTLWCWGSNSYGAIGSSTLSWSDVPIEVPGVGDVVDLCASGGHTCAVLSDGTARCWGNNGSGQLGVDTVYESAIPLQVVGLDDAVAVACGERHNCARTTGGTVRCWGDNHDGQLGDGNMGQDSYTPVAVSSLVDVVDVATGGYHSCAARADGTVWCWGIGEGGTLGTGQSPMPATDVPVQVAALDDAWALGQGTGHTAHTCAIREDCTLWCWGSNHAGTLGIGTYQDFAIAPVQTLNLMNVVTASPGHFHTCACTTDGLAFCWGVMQDTYQFGQLGHGSTAGSAVAVQVQTLDDVVSISAGSTFSCAVQGDGTAWCWGANQNGALGVGTEPTQSSVPLQVVFP